MSPSPSLSPIPRSAQLPQPSLEQSTDGLLSDEPTFRPLPNVDNDQSSDPDFLDPYPSSPPMQKPPIPQQGIPEIFTNLYATEPSYFTRPNRYFGPVSTWRTWTENERAVAQSIDLERAQDLSVHLYDAHALKKRVTAQSQTFNKRRKGKGKAPVSSPPLDGEDAVDLDTFAPPKLWTAWPLPPGEVPRDDFVSRLGADAYRVPTNTRPSAALEECLIATATRLARERWNARQWQPEIPVPTKRDMEVEHAMVADLMPDLQELQHDQVSSPATPSSSSASPNNDRPMFSSQAFDLGATKDDDADISDVNSERDTGSTSPPGKPVPITDDARARQLLLPATRSTLSKLDELLLGLHKARQSYTAYRPSSRSRSRSRTTDDDATTTEGEKTDLSTKSSRLDGFKRRRVPAASTTDTDVSMSPIKRARLASQLPRYALRDWSDVLGMASMTGWNADVVARAAGRCGHLFGENMLFRTFHSGSTAPKSPSYITEQYAVSPSASVAGPAEDSDAFEKGTVVLRTTRACRECHATKARCISSTTSKASCQRCVVNHLSCSAMKTEPLPDYFNTKSRTCPYNSCPRHTQPFHKFYHLQRHIDSVHLNSPLPSSAFASSEPDTDLVSSQEIFCPVQSCPRHAGEPYSRGTKLYEHVRKIHPEVDVKEVKKLEARRRGERRGKWTDERRKRRSTSQKRTSSRHVSMEVDVDDGDGSDAEYVP